MKETKDKKAIFFKESLKLIYKKGFKATTLRDIAQQLNFEVANIYNYIESKDSLLEGYIFDIMKEVHEYVDNIAESSYSPEEKLRLVIAKHIQFSVSQPYQVALLINEWRNLKEPKLGEFVNSMESYYKKVGSIIESGMESGSFRTVDVEIATNLVLSSIRWLFTKYTGDQQKMNPIEVEKQICDYIFGGLSIKGKD